MSGMGVLKASQSLAGDLVSTLLSGPQVMADQAMKQAKVNTQMQISAQQQQVAMDAVAMMTGIGTKVNTVA